MGLDWKHCELPSLVVGHVEFPLPRQTERDVSRQGPLRVQSLHNLAVYSQDGHVALSINRHVELSVGAKRHSVGAPQSLILEFITDIAKDLARSEAATGLPAISVDGSADGLIHVKVIVRTKGDAIS